MLHLFGCVFFPHHQMNIISRLNKLPCAFLLAIAIHKRYFCYDPCSLKIRVSRNVVFLEHIQYYISIGKSPSISKSILSSSDLQKSAEIDTENIHNPFRYILEENRIISL